MTESRWATDGDADALSAFLLAHADRAMFALSNFRRFGVRGGDHQRASRFFLTLQGNEIRGAVSVDQGGSVLLVGDPDLDALHRALAKTNVLELLGETGIARRAEAQLGLSIAARNMNDDEPHFALDLTDLEMPDTSGLYLGPLAAMPREQAILWRAAYAQDVLGDDPAGAAARAVQDVEAYLLADSHRVLFRGTEPVAMTGFNATLPEIVQIGGVYTPPDLRGQGLARAAVALHLAQARANGVRRAVLFAATDAAARAYRAIGFRRIGQYTIIIFTNPTEVPPCP